MNLKVEFKEDGEIFLFPKYSETYEIYTVENGKRVLKDTVKCNENGWESNISLKEAKKHLQQKPSKNLYKEIYGDNSPNISADEIFGATK